MLRTMAALARTGPGFDPDRVLSLQFFPVGQQYGDDAAVIELQQRLLDRFRAIPGVSGAALASQIPFGGNGDCYGFHAQGYMKPNTADDPCVERYGITPGYLRVMNIPVVAGRAFTDADTAKSEPVLLISQSTARAVFGGDDPLGTRVRIGGADSGDWRTIVGVVGDVHHDDLTEATGPSMYTPETQFTDSFLTAVIKSSTADAGALAAPARAAMREIEPAAPVYAVATVGALLAKSIAEQRFVMRLLGGFALVSLLLAAVGLYGVVSYGVSQRAREVGVRMALGAQKADVVRLVLVSGLTPVAVGVAAGLAAAAAATRAMGSLVYGVSPNDPLTFAGAALALAMVALLAHLVPIRRALRIEPASALRAD